MTLAEAVETIKRYCQKTPCKECVFSEENGNWCMTYENSPAYWETPTETNIYDEEEIHENCTVHILRNSVTGETSIGWWEN